MKIHSKKWFLMSNYHSNIIITVSLGYYVNFKCVKKFKPL